MRTLFIFLIFLSLATLNLHSQSTEGEITTFILVRHAEKTDNSADPMLSPEGIERASLLARMLDEIRFDAVYSTPLIRTTETAREVAERNGKEIIEYDHRNPEKLAGEWKNKHRGEYVLISGHSNSTPMFANALLGREHFKVKFDESDYGNILIVTITSDGKSRLLHMKF